MHETLKVLFLSPEVVPFAKTGGLADVAGSLPGALKKLGVDVRVGLPFYRVVREGNFSAEKVLSGLEVPFGGKSLTGNVLETRTEDGIPVYFFEREDLFDRPNLYSTPEGDYYDNLERFAFFGQAALIFAKETGFLFDVVHCHDWQTGLIPAYLKSVYKTDPLFKVTASLFTIHNVGYQGLFPKEKLATCGLPLEAFHSEGLEYWGQVSLLKAGIVYSDAITTVSPKYSQEIQTPGFGLGMDGILKKRSVDLYGILNGADYGVWDPATDPHVVARYKPGNMKGKVKNKSALIEEIGLRQDFLNRPILGMISRLSSQKGCDLLVQIVEDVVGLKAGLVILGAGEEKYQTMLIELAQKHHGCVAIKIGFDEPLAHRIMAGVDIFMVPSRYEPCGLTQMYALRYGTVPVVRATGGLDDTIEDFDPKTKKGNGFKFSAYEPEAFFEAIKRAVDLFEDSDTWKILMANGMKEDFSWDRSAKKYLKLYRSISKRRLTKGSTK
jgi:starch synthase